MSIDRRAVSLRMAAAAIATSLALGISSAAHLDFRPRVELFVGQNGNLAIVGPNRLEDQTAQVKLYLGLAMTTERSSLDLWYRPSRIYYRTFSELNFNEHRLGSDFNYELSPRSSLFLGLSLFRGQGQGIDPERPDTAVTLLPRTDQEIVTARLGGRFEATERSTWNWEVGGYLARYEIVGLEDSGTLLARLSFLHDRWERIGLGFVYDVQEVRYTDSELRIDTFVVSSEVRPGQHSTLAVGLGASRARSGANSQPNPSGYLRFNRVVGERSDFSCGLGLHSSAGSGIRRATLDGGAYLGWGVRISRQFSANVSGAYWRREDLRSLEDATPSGVRTMTTLSKITWAPEGTIELEIFHQYNHQRTLQTINSLVDADYHSFGVALRWSQPSR